MTTVDQPAECVEFYNSLKRPILILSSRAGRGNISIGEAIREYFQPANDVYHASIEDFMPAEAVIEDLGHYKLISNYFPLLLSVIYTVPFFYYRKLSREKQRATSLPVLKRFLEAHRIATVICVSHRQAFWATVLKRNESFDIAIYGVLTEFGSNLGWRHILWNEMNGFVSPPHVATQQMAIPATLLTLRLPLTARAAFHALSRRPPPHKHCLLIGGIFGQGQMMRSLRLLSRCFPDVHVYVVCGENSTLERRIRGHFGQKGNLTVYGLLDSIKDILAHCGCVVTKPGMATLLEARAAGRKIFLFKGMPIAESNNARYAIRHFGAEWFSVPAFSRWLASANQEIASWD